MTIPITANLLLIQRQLDSEETADLINQHNWGELIMRMHTVEQSAATIREEATEYLAKERDARLSARHAPDCAQKDNCTNGGA